MPPSDRARYKKVSENGKTTQENSLLVAAFYKANPRGTQKQCGKAVGISPGSVFNHRKFLEDIEI